MMLETMRQLTDNLFVDPEAPTSEVAFIWIAPNKLHEQSYLRIKREMAKTNDLHPVVFDELDLSANGYIRPGEVLFINWESINKENALIVRETEQRPSLYDIIRHTREEHNIPIVAIIDEEHMFGGRNAKKSQSVLRQIQPKVEVRVSATPLPESLVGAGENIVIVGRQDVIDAQMIKEGIVLNPDVKFAEGLNSLNQQLVHLALEKRNELALAMKNQGNSVNPLLLIQLPSDKAEMNSEDESIKEEVMEYLDKIYDINTANGKLAIWLSKEKTEGLEHIASPQNPTEVLLFKQAIALGWDCPRAAVLLIFRKLESYTFTAQTVGRILRMPEQKYYDDSRLNRGYVYTNLSTDIIQIVEDDISYMSNILSRRRDNITNITLNSTYIERPAAVRNRIGSDFKKVLKETFEKEWLVKGATPNLFNLLNPDEEDSEEENEFGEEKASADVLRDNRNKVRDFIVLNVKSIGIEIVEDLKMTGETGTLIVSNKARYVRTMNELQSVYLAFCARCLGGQWEKACIEILANMLQDVLEQIFNLFEADAMKVVLYHKNRKRFADVITKALESYATRRATALVPSTAELMKQYVWELPAERMYKEETHHIEKEMSAGAMLPVCMLNNSSRPERNFAEFLEKNSASIEWWYKNGDSGKDHFAIPYSAGDDMRLFYVDFIIRMRNGKVFLFDTKTEGSDPDAVEKHNALIDYIMAENSRGANLAGGIIIQDSMELWKYSPMKIDTTESLDGWSTFHPSDYK